MEGEIDPRSISAKRTNLPVEYVDLTSSRWVKRSRYGSFLQSRADSPYEGTNLSAFEPLEDEKNKEKALKHLKNLYSYRYMKNHPEQRQKQIQSKMNNENWRETHRKADLTRKNIMAHQQFILA